MTMITASQLLRQWDDGRPVWSWRMDGHEHHIQCLGFEILRWFLTRPYATTGTYAGNTNVRIDLIPMD